MYIAQDLKERINKAAKEKGVSVRSVLIECGLNPNTVNQIKDSKGLSCFALAQIADALDCSVDYLLGRSEWLDGEKCNALIDKMLEGASLSDLVAEYGANFVVHYDAFRYFADRLEEERRALASR